MVRAKKTATADAVVVLLEKNIHPFWPPGMIVSEKAFCFTTTSVSKLMEAHGAWSPVEDRSLVCSNI